MSHHYDPRKEVVAESFFKEVDPSTVEEIETAVAGTGMRARFSRPLQYEEVIVVDTDADGVTTARVL